MNNESFHDLPPTPDEQPNPAETQNDRTSQRVLASISGELVASLDEHDMLERTARLALPDLGDYCIIDLFGPDGQTARVAAAHVDPAQQALLDEVRDYPPDPKRHVGATSVLKTGVATLVEVITDEYLVGIARDEDHLRLLRELGPRSVLIVPLRARGAIIGSMLLTMSYSERQYTVEHLHLAEEVSNRVALALDNARLYHEAQEALRIRDAFLSVAAHELKNPITIISGNLQLVLRHKESFNEMTARLLQIALEQTDRLRHLLDKLLDASRLEQGQLELVRSQIDLNALVWGVVESMRSATEQHTLNCYLPEEPLIISGDSLRMEQVVQNLVGNAIKYSPHGGRIDVTLACQSRKAIVIVRDEGIGIPAEALSRLFQQFYRAPNTRVVNVPGFGLGLYLAREIVERHGGTIEVTSIVGRGSTFTVKLPLAKM